MLAEHFLLLGVHADHRLAGRGELLDLAVDVPKLRVAVRVAGALGGPRGPLQGEPLGLGAARPPCPRPPGAPAGSARRPASGWTSPSSATGTPGPHADPARPAPAGPGPGPDRARAAACGPHPPPAPGRPAHRPTRAHRAPPSTPPPAQHAPPGAHPHTPTPGQPLPTPGAAAAHPDGAAARRTPPRAPPRSVSSRRDPTAQLPHQTHQLLIGDSQGPGVLSICHHSSDSIRAAAQQ
jgi:hypothetical protein